MEIIKVMCNSITQLSKAKILSKETKNLLLLKFYEILDILDKEENKEG